VFVSKYEHQLRPEKITTGKKGTSHLAGYVFQTTGKNYDPAKFWRELGLHFFPADCFGIDFFFQNNPPENNMEPVHAKFWRELGLHYFPADCIGIFIFFFWS
jgi:hypothetical protein